jgi:MOSC domain-containing protein YiiM
VAGDRQNDTKHHGGPMRAVCLFSAEVIERLRGEGHPIAPGTAGENVTVAGIDWSAVGVGSRFVFEGGVELEVTDYTPPCKTIAASFRDREFKRILQKLHPGESRVYTRVVTEGEVVAGEGVRLAPAGESATPS